LDYDRIRQVGYGSVSQPNTSFKKEPAEASFDPVSRWRKAFSQEQLEMFEGLVGECLRELGYPLLTERKGTLPASLTRMKRTYSKYFASRFWLKNSAAARMVRGPMSSQEVDYVVMGDDHPAKVVIPVRVETGF
ncbi:MAG TPA: hypothetical protein VGF08_07575, partial [Terriglobales bacterium]